MGYSTFDGSFPTFFSYFPDAAILPGDGDDAAEVGYALGCIVYLLEHWPLPPENGGGDDGFPTFERLQTKYSIEPPRTHHPAPRRVRPLSTSLSLRHQALWRKGAINPSALIVGHVSKDGCSNFDIIWDHLSGMSGLFTTPPHAVHCALLGRHAYWMLIGACDPML